METQSQPQETLEQQPLVGQEVAPEIIGQQPLEDSQPLETMNQPQGTRTTAFGNFRVQPTNGGPTSRELQSGNTTITIRNTTS